MTTKLKKGQACTCCRYVFPSFHIFLLTDRMSFRRRKTVCIWIFGSQPLTNRWTALWREAPHLHSMCYRWARTWLWIYRKPWSYTHGATSKLLGKFKSSCWHPQAETQRTRWVVFPFAFVTSCLLVSCPEHKKTTLQMPINIQPTHLWWQSEVPHPQIAKALCVPYHPSVRR